MGVNVSVKYLFDSSINQRYYIYHVFFFQNILKIKLSQIWSAIFSYVVVAWNGCGCA